jgi:hypothetical protein
MSDRDLWLVGEVTIPTSLDVTLTTSNGTRSLKKIATLTSVFASPSLRHSGQALATQFS